MEYAIPAEHGMHALRGVRRQIERHDWGIRFPVEVRVTAPDDVALSTAFGRPTVYIAVHEWNDRPYEEYFREVEAIMRDSTAVRTGASCTPAPLTSSRRCIRSGTSSRQYGASSTPTGCSRTTTWIRCWGRYERVAQLGPQPRARADGGGPPA